MSQAPTNIFTKLWYKSYQHFRCDKGKNVWMDTERAKDCYDVTTGNIGKGIKGYDNNWWFCETIPEKFVIKLISFSF